MIPGFQPAERHNAHSGMRIRRPFRRQPGVWLKENRALRPASQNDADDRLARPNRYAEASAPAARPSETTVRDPPFSVPFTLQASPTSEFHETVNLSDEQGAHLRWICLF